MTEQVTPYTGDEAKTVKRIATVSGDEEHGWTVGMDDGWCIGVPSFGVAPKVGDAITLWGRGIGYTVRGIAINDTIVRYETEAAERQRFDAEQREDERRRRWAYEQAKPEYERRIAALPPSLADDLRRRIAERPEFAWDHCGLAYNLYAFEQGAEIAKHITSEDELGTFAGLPWKEQLARVPTLDDGHSGGTFGVALHAARTILRAALTGEESEGA